MQELLYQTSAITSGAGSSQTLTGTLDIGTFDLGYGHYEVPDGAAYSITLTNVGDALVVSGHVTAAVKSQCARCLEDACAHVVSDIEGYLALDQSSDVTGMQDDEYEVIPEDGVVDLAPYILAAIVVEIPPVFLCSDDCLGLCPRCGCNRNIETCDCDQQPDESNPFYALKDLFGQDDA